MKRPLRIAFALSPLPASLFSASLVAVALGCAPAKPVGGEPFAATASSTPTPVPGGGSALGAVGASKSASEKTDKASASYTAAQTATPTSADVYARVQADFVACYEQGKRAIPTMTAGKVTYHVAVERDGKASCVVPSDDSGLSNDVEDCMRKRLERETFGPSSAGFTVIVPVVVRDAKVSLGKVADAPTMEMVESQGLSEEMYDVVESLLPELKSCLAPIDAAAGVRVVYVGGRVGADGRVECAIASAASNVPPTARDCAAKTVSRAKFAPPKHGLGLVSIPIEVVRKKR